MDDLWLVVAHADSRSAQTYPAGLIQVTPGMVVGSESLLGLAGVVDRTMDREHFALAPMDGRCVLRCVRRSCATYVNGRLVETPVLVGPQDVIKAGSTVFVVTSVAPEIPTDEQEEAGVVGCSMEIDLARRHVRHAASRGLSLLLLGETGTGKGLMAEKYHEWSGRSV
jgi:hypothetical protein